MLTETNDGKRPIDVMADYRSFLPAIEGFPQDERRAIENALILSIILHSGQVRETGESVSSHPIATALIIVEECGIKEASIVITSLLHDGPEDSASFNEDVDKKTYSKSLADASDQLKKSRIDEESIEMILLLTKPHEKAIGIKSKEQAREIYYERLRNAPVKVLLVKMADRLHNLRTHYKTAPDHRERKIKETKEVYLDIFERAVSTKSEYQDSATYLMSKITEVLRELENFPDRDEPTEIGERAIFNSEECA